MCRNAREVKQVFNKVFKQLHPDKGGSKEAFVALFDEYQQAQEYFALEHGECRNKKKPKEPKWPVSPN